MAFKRKRMSKKSSRKNFSKTAQYIHPKNIHRTPMRGGFRI
nr:MAG: DNA binding protein [Microviridae sp.]